MRKSGIAALLATALIIGACAKTEDGQELPADTATITPAPAPAPMDTGGMMMDSATHDTMTMSATSM